MNAATSQHVFAGPYLDDESERAKFSAAFMDMTQGFLAFPLCMPGTQVWKGKQGRLFILSVLRKAAARSKAAMQVRAHARTCAYTCAAWPLFSWPCAQPRFEDCLRGQGCSTLADIHADQVTMGFFLHRLCL